MSTRRRFGSAKRDAVLGRAPRAALRAAAVLACAMTPLSSAHAHGTEARYMEVLDWPKPRIARTFGTNRAFLDGVPNSSDPIRTHAIGDASCVVGDLVMFDVDNGYAFDIDETVKVRLTFAKQYSTPFIVGWDRNGGTGQGLLPEIAPARGEGLQTVEVALPRARFAGQGTQGADLAIGSRNGIALCDIDIARSNTTDPPGDFGSVRLTVKDAATGRLVPARIGLYDETGRAPLASDQSLMLQRFADDLRMLAVNERTFWPSENRQAFYVDGSYEGRLPVGRYELVATRGPEYKAWRGTVDVKSGGATDVTLALERYENLPAKGWYSGDAHIHVTRDEVADPQVWGFVAAEDVHVGNLLEMGNIAALHFKQPAIWGREGRYERDGHIILSGQEDPRTGHFGHTIHHNLQQPIRLSADEYFMYNKVFEESQRQDGISGFAHMGWNQARNAQGQPNADVQNPEGQVNRGLVLLAHTGLVNFIEVLQRGRFLGDGWYRLLNLGYRVNPAAGSDWPYSDFPGIVRNFVKVDGAFDVDEWFDAYRAGRTYVTNGPFLELSVNGEGMGAELRVARGSTLDIVASSQLNPDVDRLDRLELVVLGDVMATASSGGTERATLKKTFTADHSMWIAVRSYGSKQDPQNMTVAHSAPIYVVVDGEPTWKREAVPEIVADLRAQLERMLTEDIAPLTGPEPWETRTLLADEWLLQRPLLKPQIAVADAAYAKLLADVQRYSAGAAASARPSGAGR